MTKGEQIKINDGHRFRAGFTLIELLIVIVVIAILIGLMLPVLGNMREKARVTQCKGNLKQLHAAAMTYNLTKGSLPPAKSGAYQRKNKDPKYWFQSSWGWVDWTDFVKNNSSSENKYEGAKWWGDKGLFSITNGSLWEYTGKSFKVYVCPEFKRIVHEDPEGNKINSGNPLYRSYVMNYSASSKDIRDIRASKRLLFADAGIQNSTGVVTIADQNLLDNDKNAYNGKLDGTDSGGHPEESVGTYHKGRANAIFADGHVEQITWDQTVDACSGNW